MSSRLTDFLTELKRRRVYTVGVTYVVVGLGVLGAAEVILEPLGLDRIRPFIVILTVLGLPLALVLAWAYEVTPEGVVRDRGTAVRPVPPEGPPSIAVLPFVDMSPDRDQEYFGDGLAEELINALTRLEGLRVAARTSTFTLAKREGDVAAIAGSLGVRHVLEGSVRKSGTRLRVTAQLIGAHDGYHLWSETYERELEDVFAIQDDITRAVVDALRIRLMGEDHRLIDVATQSSEAYDLYLKGRYLWRLRYHHGMSAALPCFERAIELDPHYALPYAGIADTYSLCGLYHFMTVTAAAAKGTPALERALELAPRLPQVHFSKAYHRLCLEGDLMGAEHAARRALELDRGYADALAWLAVIQSNQGQVEESADSAKRAVAMDPQNPYIAQMQVAAAGYAWRFDEAVTACDRALSLDPGAVVATHLSAVALTALGRHQESLDRWARVLELTHGQPTFRAWRIFSLMAANENTRALEELDALRELRERESLPAGALVLAYAGAGEAEEAFRWLDVAERDEGGVPLLAFGGTTSWNPIRRDARFRERMKRLGIRDQTWLEMMEA